MEYNIGNSKNQIKRIAVLINYLKSSKTNATFKEIVKKYIENGVNEVGIDQFRKDKKFMIEYGIDIICNSHYEYSINGKIPQKTKKILVNDEIKHDLPILFNLLNTEENLGAIVWLKALLNENHNIDENDWNNKDYFSSPIPELPYQFEVLKLSIEIIKNIKQGNVLIFDYKPVDTKKEVERPIVAPLQVRLYDGRYYLIAAEYKIGNYDFSYLKVMAIDQIRKWEVKEYQLNEKSVKFDYNDFVKKSKLRTYFDYCIGVTVPKEKEKRIAYCFTIRFNGWAKSYIKNKFIHYSQIEVNKKINEGKDYIDVQIEVYDTFELDFILGKFRKEFATIVDKKALKL